MPRPRLSLIERQRRKSQRLRDWRAQIPQSTAARDARAPEAIVPLFYAHPVLLLEQPLDDLEPARPESRPTQGPTSSRRASDQAAGPSRPPPPPQASSTPPSPDVLPIPGPVYDEIEALQSNSRTPSAASSRQSAADWRPGKSPSGSESLTNRSIEESEGLSSSKGEDEEGRVSRPRSSLSQQSYRSTSTSDSNPGSYQDSSDKASNDQLLIETQLRNGVQPEEEIDFVGELCRHLFEFRGCSPASHQAAAPCRHDPEAEANQSRHLTLASYIDQLRSADIPIVINRDTLLTPAEQGQYLHPNWQRIFEGRDSEEDIDRDENGGQEGDKELADHNGYRGGPGSDSGPDRSQTRDSLCLECSCIQPGSAEVTFDIDSFLGFAQDLAFARQGIDINLFPRFHTNIQNSLHLYYTVYHDSGQGERPVRVKLQNVPHYCFGRVLGHEDITLYLFFPRMYIPEKATNFPGKGGGETHNLLQTWTDSILIPAIFRYSPATSRQHIPCSWEQARQKAQAYHAERLTKGDYDKLADQGLFLHYSLHPQSLAAIWQDIQQQLLEPQNLIYREVRLFFSSKNTKLRFPYSTLSEVWQAFQRPLLAAIDLTYIDRTQVWLDLGKEVAGLEYVLQGSPPEGDSPPTSYLFKTCCLESFARWASLGEPGRSVRSTVFPTTMLRDVGDITLEMSPSCRKRREGWVFSQAYNSYKELFDAAKTKPFASPYLQQLTWDASVAKMIEKQGRAVLATNSRLRDSYQASKRRLFTALSEGSGLSYGIREEHRISLAFFEQMQPRLVYTGDWDSPVDLAAGGSPHAWCLATTDYLGFLGHNANKFLAAFEWILALGKKGRVQYENCKLATMLLQALPFAFDSGPIQRQSGLWKDQFQRRGGGGTVLGMGMERNRLAHGYMWFLGRVDWKQMVFRPQLVQEMAFTNSILRVIGTLGIKPKAVIGRDRISRKISIEP
jgi:hypothetical protein